MDIWWLHALVFIFGYVTCKTFYFFNSARISLKLLKSSRVIYLLMAVKAMEHYVTSETLMRFYLDKTDADDQTKRSFAIRYENDLEGFKKNGIEAVFNITPEIFHDSIGFDDWPSAMAYLQQNRQEAFNFWRKGE